jgi:excisionase family DNA binding protein
MPERLAYTKAEAAEALGVSVDYLEDHVLADVRVVRRGRKVLIPVSELQRWLEENAALTLASVA